MIVINLAALKHCFYYDLAGVANFPVDCLNFQLMKETCNACIVLTIPFLANAAVTLVAFDQIQVVFASASGFPLVIGSVANSDLSK